ncbi:hypothetical protein H6F77_10390 [Microcoleus sp. FACHB-831]|uniref:hypothetical protein n=1 Tax=Microcoleus sp. FACHB-831 TaxID=2692827 RepID=UPI0016880A9E|nr:hypothetical protein [Microcoleus sp. FACHB-831]MBD1921499.1 hypothetical protein [Microcoleus sp. FACHB-831]
MRLLAIAASLATILLITFSAVAQKIDRLPPAPGINLSRIQYVRGETSPDRKLERAILQTEYRKDASNTSYPLRYSYNKVDLNGDGNPEAIVSVRSFAVCGTGGCPTLIFSSDGKDYRSVVYEVLSFGRIIVTPQRTSGWNDLIQPYRDRAAKVTRYYISRFNGRKYTNSDTVRPKSTISGRVFLVSDDEHPLRP